MISLLTAYDSENLGDELFDVQNHGNPIGAAWSRDEIKSDLKNSNVKVCVLGDIKNVSGFILFSELMSAEEFQQSLIEIRHWAVKNKSQGLGSAFLSEFIKVMCEKNQKGLEIQLEVSVRNISAIKVYKKLGFQETGNRKNYYRDNSDALLFTWISQAKTV